MQPYILQEWTTIRSSVTTVTQGESEWLDLAPHQDFTFIVDVREVTTAGGNATLNVQTSPNKEDGLFQTMTGASVTMVPNTPATTGKAVLVAGNPAIPLARYVRWQITGPAGTWDATFRIVAAANCLA